MPNVRVKHPGLFRSSTDKKMFIDGIRATVARNLDGVGYDDEPLNFTPDHVDTILESYQPDDVCMSAAFLIEITGYDFPGRMKSIELRLTIVNKDLKKLIKKIQGLNGFTRSIKVRKGLICVNFIPYQAGCSVFSE